MKKINVEIKIMGFSMSLGVRNVPDPYWFIIHMSIAYKYITREKLILQNFKVINKLVTYSGLNIDYKKIDDY